MTATEPESREAFFAAGTEPSAVAPSRWPTTPRSKRFPADAPYRYQPFAGDEEQNTYDQLGRRQILHDYNIRDLGI